MEIDPGRIRLQPCPGVVELALRQRQAGEVMPLANAALGEAAPAATDLQYAAGGRQRQLRQHTTIFFRLRLIQRPIRLSEHASGVGHAGIQPQRVEIVAQVVMCRDIATRTGAGVAA